VEIRYAIPTHPRGEMTRFCQLRKDYFNELADAVNERYGWHDDASPDYRPKLHVFTEKAYGGMRCPPSL
jgi:hypothetical protein